MCPGLSARIGSRVGRYEKPVGDENPTGFFTIIKERHYVTLAAGAE